MNEMKLVRNSVVAAYRLKNPEYPEPAPFHPGSSYPEYRGGNIGSLNLVYDGVRELFRLLQLDEIAYGTSNWNPLGTIVFPGDKVLIKPNLIWHSHRYKPDEWQQVITHGSIVRAMIDYALIALQGRGEIWIADGPQLDGNWAEIMSRTGLQQICDWYRQTSSVPVHLLDLRDTWEDVRGDVLYGRTVLPGDPAGSVDVNLGARSRFQEHAGGGRYYGASYEQAETNYHHSGGRHEYRISRTAASADVLINLPKMKTHKKTGVTLCLKNLVGINTGRNWLPHHTDGDPSNGGDQFPAPTLKNNSERWGIRRIQRLALRYPHLVAPLFRVAKKCAAPVFGRTSATIRSGNWHGNDTCWRMVQDINRCLFYSDGEHFPTPAPKRFFGIVDGVIAGDGDGPAAPDAHPAGLLIAGVNPVAVDCVAARLMGFDPLRLPVLYESFASSDLPLATFAYHDISVRSNCAQWEGPLSQVSHAHTLHMRPHFGWTGAIEYQHAAVQG